MSIPRARYEEVLAECHRLAQRGQRLRPQQPQIAAFDADGTIWNVDVADLLWSRLLSKRALHERAGAPLARAVRSTGLEPEQDPYRDFGTLDRLYRDGRCSEETIVRAMLQGLAGLSEEEVRGHASEAVAGSAPLRHSASGRPAKMLADLRGLGYRVIIVSSSPRWAVEAALEPLGFDPSDLIAGQVAVVGGRLTDGIIEPLPHGQGKIQALLRHFNTVPRIAVGNGLGDLAMLEAASHLKLLVNPSDDLLRACEDIGGSTWSMEILDATPARPPLKARRAAATAAAGTRARPQARP